jgi:chromosome partitioning protein
VETPSVRQRPAKGFGRKRPIEGRGVSAGNAGAVAEAFPRETTLEGSLEMATTVCLLNQKGGVGKTSTCYHLAGTLARDDRRVLLVDNDPQASLTQGFFGPEGMRAIPAVQSVAAAYDPEQEPIASSLILPAGLEGVSIIPGSPTLAEFNMLPPAQWGRSVEGLRSLVSEVGNDYDLILIDNPPNLHLLAAASMVASDAIVIPLQAEDFGAQGLGPVRAAITAVQAGANPEIRLAGYLVTMFDKRLGIHLAYESKLREMYGNDVFDSVFPRAKDFVEAVSTRLPISHYRPKSAAAKATKAVADELLGRLERIATEQDRRVA